ncbi:hypothetical protein [Priestia aryabhattai]|uniref:hypothetical protein n=1 Tax=Priestia aryabhattai TaxID=412384 RepID=UPI003CEAE76C
MIDDSENKELPFHIELLFDNKLLDIVSFLCVISLFSRSRKGISLDKAAFYFAIVTSLNISDVINEDFFKQKSIKYDVDIRFIQIKEKSKKIVVYLLNSGLVDLVQTSELCIRVNKDGSNVVRKLNSSFYKDILIKTKKVKKEIAFTNKNLKKLLGVDL